RCPPHPHGAPPRRAGATPAPARPRSECAVSTHALARPDRPPPSNSSLCAPSPSLASKRSRFSPPLHHPKRMLRQLLALLHHHRPASHPLLHLSHHMVIHLPWQPSSAFVAWALRLEWPGPPGRRRLRADRPDQFDRSKRHVSRSPAGHWSVAVAPS